MEDEQNGKFNIWWDEQENIMCIKVLAYIDEENAKSIYAQTIGLADKHLGKAAVLVDLKRADSASFSARKIFVDLFKSGKYSRCAFYGFNTFDRVFITFMLRASAAQNVNFFATEEKARQWLKEK
jgi:anti-anti-sigma regulatory factor